MLPDDERHSTEAGYEQHVRDNEDPCDACYQAKILAGRRRSKRKQLGHKYTVPVGTLTRRLHDWRAAGATYGEISDHTGIEASRVWELVNEAPQRIYTRTANRLAVATGTPVTTVGVTRRIQALMWMGYSANRIAVEARLNVDTINDARDQPRVFVARKVKNAVVSVYDRIHMTPAVGETRQEKAGVTRAKNLARRNGWASPMAWDAESIDDVRVRPVDSFLPPDRATAITDLAAQGENATHIARRLGLRRDSLEKWCQRHLPDVWRDITAREGDWNSSGNQGHQTLKKGAA